MTLLMVHGYNDDGHYYPLWEEIFHEHKTEPFYWDSSSLGLGWFKALFSGHLTSYGHAYEKLSLEAADELYRRALYSDEKLDIVCHSLGARVVLSVMDTLPNCFNKVLFLNGAEGCTTASPIISKNKETHILNVSVHEDDVLSKTGRFRAKGGCMGQRMLAVSNARYQQIFLDGEADQAAVLKKYGWKINGDNPDKIGDHSYSFTNRENHKLLQKFMNAGAV